MLGRHFSERDAITQKMNTTSQAFPRPLHGRHKLKCGGTSLQKSEPAGDQRKKMADFMFLIDLAMFAAVIACAAALLREEKTGLSSRRYCSCARDTERDIRAR